MTNTHQSIFQFIDGTVIVELPKLARSAPFLGAAILAGGIEFMGACLDSHPIHTQRQSAARFCLAINTLFPKKYHKYSRVPPYEKAQTTPFDFYKRLRCGMAHALKPDGVGVTTGLTARQHLSVINRGGRDLILVDTYRFADDYVKAARKLKRILNRSPLAAKLHVPFVHVWTL